MGCGLWLLFSSRLTDTLSWTQEEEGTGKSPVPVSAGGPCAPALFSLSQAVGDVERLPQLPSCPHGAQSSEAEARGLPGSFWAHVLLWARKIPQEMWVLLTVLTPCFGLPFYVSASTVIVPGGGGLLSRRLCV